MHKTVSIIISLALVAALGIIFLGGSDASTNTVSNVEIRDGVQYVTIQAGGGYTPATSVAQAGIPTKIIMNTQGTYDCSADVSIPALSYRKTLQATGQEVIDAGTPTAQKLAGTCGMGMYNFSVQFQ